MTANLVREPNTGTWIHSRQPEVVWCVRTVHVSWQDSTITLPYPAAGRVRRGERVWPATQVPAAWNQDVDLMKSWPKLASAEPGHLVTWSFGPLALASHEAERRAHTQFAHTMTTTTATTQRTRI